MPRPEAAKVRTLVETLGDGRSKLYLTWKILQFRREHEDLFRRGEYVPLRTEGAHGANVCAFARRHANGLLITIAPRLTLRLLGERELLPLGEEVWADTLVELPRDFNSDAVQNILDGTQVVVSRDGERRMLRIAAALTHFPVAVLYRPP